jgi:hypothetical protein
MVRLGLTPKCCAIASSPERGVVDGQNRVFNYKNLYVVDGSMLGSLWFLHLLYNLVAHPKYV